MGWSIYTHADIDSRRPRPLAVCDKCGFVYNRDRLRWQHQWEGLSERNIGILVCPSCIDDLQPQLKTLILPLDPIPIMNPRPGEFSGMVISSSPDAFNTIAQSQIVVQSSATDGTTEIGDRSPLVTQDSSLPITTEVTVTPYPDQNAGAGGYTRMPGAST